MFDPYHKWLGIPIDQRPPTYYQLLGIASNEQDREVIREAAIRQTAHLRAYQRGAHADECTRLLNEIALAQTVLLDPAKRRDYDARLARTALTKRPPRTRPTPAAPLPVRTPSLTRRPWVVGALLGLLVLVIAGGLTAVLLAGLFFLPRPAALETRSDAPRDPPAEAPPVPEKAWAHCDISAAELADGCLRIQPFRSIATRKFYAGPIEVTVVASTAGTHLGLYASGGACAIFNFTSENGDHGLVICRPVPDSEGDFSKDELIAREEFPLEPDTFYTLRWRLTEQGMTVSVNDQVIFREERKYDLSSRRPVKLLAHASALRVKSLEVKPLP
jgi:hypothetical protein